MSKKIDDAFRFCLRQGNLAVIELERSSREQSEHARNHNHVAAESIETMAGHVLDQIQKHHISGTIKILGLAEA